MNKRKKSQEVHAPEPEFNSKCVSKITYINISKMCVLPRKLRFSIPPISLPLIFVISNHLQPPRIILIPPELFSSSRLFGTRECLQTFKKTHSRATVTGIFVMKLKCFSYQFLSICILLWNYECLSQKHRNSKLRNIHLLQAK